MASANDLLSVFVTLEFSTFGFYVLVAYLREDMASNEAGIKFFILGVFAAGLLAYGISLVYGETGKLVFSDMKIGTGHTGIGHRLPADFRRIGIQNRRRALSLVDSRHLSRLADTGDGVPLDRAQRERPLPSS